tara:strand:- start:176 stop:598 length:423 start_codon:yes stop_codon:yes gene_type:complete
MPIEFISNIDFVLTKKKRHINWLINVANIEGYNIKNVVYVFLTDDELKSLNVKYLNHDYYTDVLSFNDSVGKDIKGDIAISIQRVKENAKLYSPSFEEELRRVMVHGLLHFMNYKDTTKEEVALIRAKEEKMLGLFHVKQ